jgi:hypothetical protein
MRRLVTVILAASMLVLPSAALAQSAGDEQYADPFGQTDDQGGGDGQLAQAPEPEPAPEPAQSDEALGQSEPEIAQTAAPTLPATGLPAALLAGSGALLLAGGTTLRRLAS